MRKQLPALLIGFLVCSSLQAQDKPFSKDNRISAERLGLPKHNERTSEPFVVRVYKEGESGGVAKPQPQGYPFSLREDYKLKEGETVRVHEGVDIQSRPTSRHGPAPLDFNAGVHGVVVEAGNNPSGMIGVSLHDGTVIQYLHTSKAYVKKGDVVAPDTKLGVTGMKGAGVIHLHIQAKRIGSAVSPDLAFQIGQRPLESKPTLESPDDAIFDPDLYCPLEPEIENGVVKACVAPKSKWIVEVIGQGGRVDLTLGEFYTHESATRCAVTWSESRPDDLRLTREREVPLK